MRHLTIARYRGGRLRWHLARSGRSRLPDAHCGALEEGRKKVSAGGNVVERSNVIVAIAEFEVSANVQYGFRRILRDSLRTAS